MRYCLHGPAAEAARISASRMAAGMDKCRTRSVLLSMVLALVVFATVAQATAGVAGVKVRPGIVIVGPQGDPLRMPSDAAVGPDGSLYVLDGTAHRVVVYDVDGRFKFKFGSRGSDVGQMLFPLGIAASAEGKVYVADSGNHRVQIFQADGKPLNVIDLPKGEAGAADPTDVAVDPNRSRLYVADNDNHRVLVYGLGGYEYEATLGGPGLGRREFRYPFLMDTTSRGYVLVVESINTRVQVLNNEGKFVGFIGGWGVKAGQLFRPKGVVSYRDRIFVTDSYLGRVQVFDLSGELIGMLTDQTGVAVKFVTPTGITVDAKRGRLYVVELKANRVARMDLE